MTDDPSRSVIVGSYINPWDAYIACGRLRVEGVYAWVAYDHHVWSNWRLSTALGGVRIMATAIEARPAKDILAAHDRGEYENCLSEEDLDAARLHCSVCNSTNVETRRFGTLVPLLLLFFFFGAIFPVRQDRHHCRNCGHNWIY